MELETPLGDINLVRDYLQIRKQEPQPVIYLYLPEHFGDTKETLQEFVRLLEKQYYCLVALYRQDGSGADARIYYGGSSSSPPKPQEQLEYVAKILRENIIHPKGVTTLAKAER